MLNRWLFVIQKSQAIFWFALAFYLIYETLRSWNLVYEYPLQIIRWLGLFVLLIPLYFILKRESQKQYKHLPLFIICCSVVYSVAYLAQGLICEANHISRYADQGNFVAGSSYAVYPFIIVIPAVIKLISSPNAKIRALVIVCVVLMVSVGFYYDSRVLGYTLAGFVGLSWFVLPWRKALLFCTVIIGTWFLLSCYVTFLRSTDGTILGNSAWTILGKKIDISYFSSYVNLYGSILNNSTEIIAGTVQIGDADRLTHIISPINAITVNPITALFGYGTYEHHLVLHPFLQEVADSRGLGVKINEFVRTTGFGAYLTDYGFVGMFLLLGNVFCGALSIFLQKTRFSLVLVSALGIGILWLVVSNIIDNMLFWLLIAPFGILWKMGIDKQ